MWLSKCSSGDVSLATQMASAAVHDSHSNPRQTELTVARVCLYLAVCMQQQVQQQVQQQAWALEACGWMSLG
jgi:hypothetical protein